MTHTYKITGMTCSGCEATVKSNLLKLPEIESVELSKDTGIANIGMSKHISVADLQNAIGVNSKYTISEDSSVPQMKEERTWLATYRPLIILFGLIFSVSLIASKKSDGAVEPTTWMRYFMAGFFLCFSYFKLINVKGFADSYSMYDVVAKRIKAWGFIYPFTELALGILYAMNLYPLYTNIATIIIMGISSIGVIESVMNKKKIQCACLGAVFNLPMSTVTIIEDLLMVGMAGAMIYLL
ncbi:MAG TPA: MauE/DoxX family redox-associated membrane protein [Bacteroidia bacterium]|jgi:copper chaperone CopZ|nr:MauE/DoxX family redox-associated membrane protein [Bacteroidia bacterium]